MIQNLIVFYLDFKNSQMSISDYAKKYNITEKQCKVLLSAGSELSNQ